MLELLERVHAHLDALRELFPHKPIWWEVGPTWSEQELARFEATHFPLPAAYRAWLAEVGDGGAGFVGQPSGWSGWMGTMRPLARRSAANLAAAAKPFRMREDSQTVTRPISGVLFLGDMGCPAFLVVRGKSAGEIWLDGITNGGSFHRASTFEDSIEAWLDHGPKFIAERKHRGRRRDVGELAGIEPDKRWKELCSGVVAWLATGPDVFVENYRHEDDTHRALLSASDSALTELSSEPALARTAAVVLSTIAMLRTRHATPVEQALALFDADPPDVSPASLARLVAALGDRKARGNTYSAGRWITNELIRTHRLDEAMTLIRMLEPQPEDWVTLARALIAKRRAAEAFALFDELTFYGRVDKALHTRACMHWETGDREQAVACLERALAVSDWQDMSTWLNTELAAARRGDFDPSTRLVKPRAPRGPENYPFVQRWLHPIDTIALLYAAAGDADHMADAAIAALEIEGLRRDRVRHGNCTAYLRIAQALAGKKPTRKPALQLRYHTDAHRDLAKRILAQTGELGITIGLG